MSDENLAALNSLLAIAGAVATLAGAYHTVGSGAEVLLSLAGCCFSANAVAWSVRHRRLKNATAERQGEEK